MPPIIAHSRPKMDSWPSPSPLPALILQWFFCSGFYNGLPSITSLDDTVQLSNFILVCRTISRSIISQPLVSMGGSVFICSKGLVSRMGIVLVVLSCIACLHSIQHPIQPNWYIVHSIQPNWFIALSLCLQLAWLRCKLMLALQINACVVRHSTCCLVFI